MRTIIYAMLVFDMCIYDHSFVYPVYIMINIHCVYTVHALFEYNNLNIVDRVVKIRGKYFRGLAITVELGEGVGGAEGGCEFNWMCPFIYPILTV